MLLEHEAVRECAVTGVPDPRARQGGEGHRGFAEGFEGSELIRELQTWVKQRPRRTSIPRIVEYVDALPKTVNGKIRRAAIRESDQEAPKDQGARRACV